MRSLHEKDVVVSGRTIPRQEGLGGGGGGSKVCARDDSTVRGQLVGGGVFGYQDRG